MKFTKEQILNYLIANNIPYTLYEHKPFMTVDVGLAIIKSLKIPGIIIKNLFLKDDHKNVHLVSAAFDTKINLKQFGKATNLKNIRFADTTMLMQYLGVEQGSVTPLALINDAKQEVQMFLDSRILQHEYIQIHPLQNDATIVIKPQDLLKFLKGINKEYRTYNFIQNQEQIL